MNEFLFLGSSHVASLKRGFDTLEKPPLFYAKFFAAPGADLAFTEVKDNRIVPALRSTLSQDNYFFFFAEGGSQRDSYLTHGRTMLDVQTQFQITGNADFAYLGSVSAIFYVAGTSPYDFVRLGEGVAPLSKTLRLQVLEYLLGAGCVLRKNVEDIRYALPHVKHVYIGTPLQYVALPSLTPVEQEIVAAKRHYISQIAGSYLFDEVFMPPEDILEPTLLATKRSFFENGRQEAESFQGRSPTKSDFRHANSQYGRYVIDNLVLKYIAN